MFHNNSSNNNKSNHKYTHLLSAGNDPTTPCDSTSCDSVRCRFRVGDQCVLRDSRPMTWFMARSQCKAAGGDLWTVNKLDDMFQVQFGWVVGSGWLVGWLVGWWVSRLVS